MKPIITWVVVADGGKLRIFENRGPGKGLIPVQGLNREELHLRDRDIEADRPGRSYSSMGYGRSAIQPQTDPVDYREAAFAKSVAGTLEQKWSAGAYQRLIIAASPTALGNLRAALCPAVDKAIVAEVPKDLTHVPTPDIARHFETVLAV